MKLRHRLERFLEQKGLALHRQTRSCNACKDPFADQRALLGNRGGSTPIIFDVGANVGQTTLRYRSIFPAAQIFAFEPFPEAFSVLAGIAALDKNIHPHALALAQNAGWRTLHVNAQSATNSLLSGVRADMIEARDRVQVPVTSLDQFTREQGLNAPDILKMDVQGGELMVLQGAESLLRAERISLVYLEVLFVPQYEGQAWFHEITALLSACGYALYDLYDLKYNTCGQLGWADALFLCPALAKGAHAGVF